MCVRLKSHFIAGLEIAILLPLPPKREVIGRAPCTANNNICCCLFCFAFKRFLRDLFCKRVFVSGYAHMSAGVSGGQRIPLISFLGTGV